MQTLLLNQHCLSCLCQVSHERGLTMVELNENCRQAYLDYFKYEVGPTSDDNSRTISEASIKEYEQEVNTAATGFLDLARWLLWLEKKDIAPNPPPAANGNRPVSKPMHDQLYTDTTLDAPSPTLQVKPGALLVCPSVEVRLDRRLKKGLKKRVKYTLSSGAQNLEVEFTVNHTSNFVVVTHRDPVPFKLKIPIPAGKKGKVMRGQGVCVRNNATSQWEVKTWKLNQLSTHIVIAPHAISMTMSVSSSSRQ